MSLLEVYHICISNSTLYTSYNLYFSANSQRKHQVQTRHFDRKSTQNATSFHLAIETVLLGVLACFSSAFLAIRCLQPDRQSGLVQHIDHAALGEGFFQAAKVGVLLAELCQPLSQSGIVGLYVGGVLALVEQDGKHDMTMGIAAVGVVNAILTTFTLPLVCQPSCKHSVFTQPVLKS